MAAPPRSQVDLLMGAGMPAAQARTIAASLDMPSLPLVGDPPEATIAMNCSRDADGEWRYLADGPAALISLPRSDPMYIANAVAGLAGKPVDEWVMVWEAPATSPPANVEIPYLSQEGDVLNCTMGTWTGAPTQYAYQWKHDGTTDIGADEASYVVDDADIGHSITCVVTATNSLGSTEAPASNAVLVPGPDEDARGAPDARSAPAGRDPATGQFTRGAPAEPETGEAEGEEGAGGPE
jgi:hypothetical protein